ncbi:MAG: DNA repair exonuclease [Tissierellia bacterium]|nr:DNA repair exonuclease [Tissierellia bacterium]
MIVKFLHISDLHLCDTFKTQTFFDPYAKRQMQWRALERAVSYANQKNVHFLLLSGDVYEREYFTSAHCRRFLDVIAGFQGIQTIMIGGNHDYYQGVSVFDGEKAPKNFTLVREDGIVSLDFPSYQTTIWAHSWTQPSYEKNQVDKLLSQRLDFKNRFNIFMVHSGLETDGPYFPMSLKELPHAFDYIALGHVHKPGVVDRNAAYAGSLEPLSMKETGTHGGILGMLDTVDESLQLYFSDLSLSEYLDVVVNVDEKTIQEIEKEICGQKNGEKETALRVTLTGRMHHTIYPKELQAVLLEHFSKVQVRDARIEYKEDHIENSFIDRLKKQMESQHLRYEYQEKVLRKALDLLWRTGK